MTDAPTTGRWHYRRSLASRLIVLVTLGVRVWKAFVKADGLGTGKSAALASTGAVLTMLALFSLVAVMANLQGVVAPYSSLLPMLTTDTSDAQLTGTLDQIRWQLADSSGTAGHTAPALQVMTDDFARYHVAMAVISAIVAAALLWFAVTIVNAPHKGTLGATISSGISSYTPQGGASGTDTFTYYLTDVNGLLSSTVTVTITIGGC